MHSNHVTKSVTCYLSFRKLDGKLARMKESKISDGIQTLGHSGEGQVVKSLQY
jgi:hypothetical protein